MVSRNDVLVRSFDDGSLFVDVFLTDKDRVYYSICVGFRDYNNEWINRRITILEEDLPKLMGLLRLAGLMPKKSYGFVKANQLVKAEEVI